MLRLTEVKLPLDHPEEAIKTAILKKLHIAPTELIRYSIFKRSYDARKKEIVFVYLLDVETTQEKRLLQRFKKDPHVMPTPDTSYRYVAKVSDGAIASESDRPIVIGAGPAASLQGCCWRKWGFDR